MIGIYKITNKLNRKCYIGQSTNIKKRWENHKSEKGFDHYPLYRAFKKYGIENFEFEVLEECSKDELEHMEYFYILLYGSDKNGYNQTLSTKNPLLDEPIMKKAIENMTKTHRTKEHREKQREITKKLWQKDEYRNKMMDIFQTEEYKNKISKASKKAWANNREQMLEALRESWDTPEMRKTRSENQKRKFEDEEYRKQNKEDLKKAKEKYLYLMKNDEEFKKDYIQKTRKASEPKMKQISMLDKKTGEVIETFKSLAEATRWIQNNTKYVKADYSTIRKSGKSDTRSAYGYKWKLHESVETIRKE